MRESGARCGSQSPDVGVGLPKGRLPAFPKPSGHPSGAGEPIKIALRINQKDGDTHVDVHSWTVCIGLFHKSM